MAPFRKWLLVFMLACIGVTSSGCGGGSPRVLRSISVIPASADAQSSPNGEVQFTVSGAYSEPPSPSPVTPSGWSVSDPTIATISPNGVAQCNPGAAGSVTVKASASGTCSGTGCTAVLFSGTAQLICP